MMDGCLFGRIMNVWDQWMVQQGSSVFSGLYIDLSMLCVLMATIRVPKAVFR